MKRILLVAALLFLSLADAGWAALAKLIRQETRLAAGGEKVVVCVYAAGDREIERVYPMGNFCPQYADV